MRGDGAGSSACALPQLLASPALGAMRHLVGIWEVPPALWGQGSPKHAEQPWVVAVAPLSALC